MIDLDSHKKKVQSFLENPTNHSFDIIEPCGLDNYGVLPLPKKSAALRSETDIVALTLAGGAASRFGLGKPKLDVSVTSEGHSFLDLKVLENQKIGNLDNQAFIIPEGRPKTQSTYEKTPALYIHQGKDLKTNTWTKDFEPILNDDKIHHQVPAGHGSLTHTFSQIKEHFPDSKGLWIRNIDNVVGWSQEVVETTNRFLDLFCSVNAVVSTIRKRIHQGNADYTQAMQDLVDILEVKPDESLSLEEFISVKLFHNTETSKTFWQKPFSILGMVANSGSDTGGAPFLTSYQGKAFKICLEGPHYSQQDKQKFAENPQPYFNPVFIATELRELKFDSNHPFWAITQKSTEKHGEYFFHEEFLSELLGNSLEMNCLFFEIPRSLFKPHKKLEDIQNISIEDLK